MSSGAYLVGEDDDLDDEDEAPKFRRDSGAYAEWLWFIGAHESELEAVIGSHAAALLAIHYLPANLCEAFTTPKKLMAAAKALREKLQGVSRNRRPRLLLAAFARGSFGADPADELAASLADVEAMARWAGKRGRRRIAFAVEAPRISPSLHCTTEDDAYGIDAPREYALINDVLGPCFKRLGYKRVAEDPLRFRKGKSEAACKVRGGPAPAMTLVMDGEVQPNFRRAFASGQVDASPSAAANGPSMDGIFRPSTLLADGYLSYATLSDLRQSLERVARHLPDLLERPQIRYPEFEGLSHDEAVMRFFAELEHPDRRWPTSAAEAFAKLTDAYSIEPEQRATAERAVVAMLRRWLSELPSHRNACVQAQGQAQGMAGVEARYPTAPSSPEYEALRARVREFAASPTRTRVYVMLREALGKPGPLAPALLEEARGWAAGAPEAWVEDVRARVAGSVDPQHHEALSPLLV